MTQRIIISGLFCLFFSSLTYAASDQVTIFNNSENYIMSVEYISCPHNQNCTDRHSIEIPNAKMGKNYVEIPTDYLVVTEVVEKDTKGNIKVVAQYTDSYKGCRADWGLGNNPIANVIILDDLHSSDRVVCTRSSIPLSADK